MPQKLARITVDMPVAEHKRLKAAALMMDLTIKDYVRMSIDDFMEKRPNKVTEKALKQSKSGKNLKKFDSLDDLFADLGI